MGAYSVASLLIAIQLDGTGPVKVGVVVQVPAPPPRIHDIRRAACCLRLIYKDNAHPHPRARLSPATPASRPPPQDSMCDAGMDNWVIRQRHWGREDDLKWVLQLASGDTVWDETQAFG
jgi:hypothetical protein